MSLADYVGRMKDGQDAIYYVTADSHSAARNSPHLEVFRKTTSRSCCSAIASTSGCCRS